VERHWEDQNLENLQNPLSVPKGEKPGLLGFMLHHLIGRAKFLFLMVCNQQEWVYENP
jgi:hypothetical protein